MHGKPPFRERQPHRDSVTGQVTLGRHEYDLLNERSRGYLTLLKLEATQIVFATQNTDGSHEYIRIPTEGLVEKIDQKLVKQINKLEDRNIELNEMVTSLLRDNKTERNRMRDDEDCSKHSNRWWHKFTGGSNAKRNSEKD